MDSNDLKLLKSKYDEDGYIYLQSFLSENELKQVEDELNDIINHRLNEMPDNFVVYENREDPGTLKQLQDINHYSTFFNQMLSTGKFKDLAELLLNDEPVPKNLEYFNKPPVIGKATPPHQDGYYFMLKPVKALTMWLALEPADEENGCVRYLKGSHLKPMRQHGRTQTAGFSQGITDYGETDRQEEVFFRVKAGDLLVHDAMTIHRTDSNESNRSRKALGFIYFGASAKEDVEAKAAYLAKLNKEKAAAAGS